MTSEKSGASVELISIDLIDIPNPRLRNRTGFKEIVENIGQIGLKRPITVTQRRNGSQTRYDLVCGQGRLEAYQALGQREIPAFIVDASAEDCMVMSLVENLARRHHQPIDLLQDIGGMKKRGYKAAEIAGKTGLSTDYVRGVIRLLNAKEHRLLRAVEIGQMPISVAVQIAETSDADLQRVLQEAYESKLLRGRRLIAAKRLIERRRHQGKGSARLERARNERSPSLEGLLRSYKEDAEKKQLLVRRAATTRDHLVFVTEALRKLAADENFLTLLRAEGLELMPKNLVDRAGRARTARP